MKNARNRDPRAAINLEHPRPGIEKGSHVSRDCPLCGVEDVKLSAHLPKCPEGI